MHGFLSNGIFNCAQALKFNVCFCTKSHFETVALSFFLLPRSIAVY